MIQHDTYARDFPKTLPITNFLELMAIVNLTKNIKNIHIIIQKVLKTNKH